MILLMQNITILTIWCLGITVVTQKGMALYFIREWAEQKKSIWYDPLILCEWCLASIHSIISFFIAIGIGVIKVLSWKLLFMWPLVVMGASFATGIIWTLYKMIEIKTKYYQNAEQLSHFEIRDRKSNHKQRFNTER